LQDHNLSLQAAPSLRLLLGYSRNRQSGPSLTTSNLGGSGGTEAALFGNVRRLQDEYRLGAEFDWKGWRFSGLRGWEVFRDDTEYTLNPLQPVSPNQAGPVVKDFNRVEPYHGRTPYWQAALAHAGRRHSVHGVFRYASGERAFIHDETASGSLQFGPLARQVLVAGNGRRPLISGNLSFNSVLTSRLTAIVEVNLYRVRMEGDNFYQELNSGTLDLSSRAFELLGIRTVSGSANLVYRVRDWLSVHGGYRPAARLIRSTQQSSIGAELTSVTSQQSNTSHAGVAGVRLRPFKQLSALLEAEVGRNSRPFSPISDRDYHTLHGRVQYRTSKLTMLASVRTNYNFNSVALSSHSSRSRQYGIQGSWFPSAKWSIDASYMKNHLDAISGIAYFSAGQLVTGDRSWYISNLHTGTLGVRAAVVPRTELYVGYVFVEDTGDGRQEAMMPAGSTGLSASEAPAFRTAQTFPLRYHTPMARLSIALHPNLHLNVGYQQYRYSERFGAPTLVLSALPDLQNYRAHTGYTSLLWSF
ncbi:MAG: hypothetical protein ACRD7E_14320, partial [Bryobacteraceae bacterium]